LEQERSVAIRDPPADALDADETGRAIVALGLQETDDSLALDVTGELLADVNLDRAGPSVDSS
jgi:hypothetical protein